jgi:hypothetical protein
MEKANELRKEEHDNNTKDIQTGRDGLSAVEEAIKILDEFYHGEHGVGGANSATVFVQASPLDEGEEAYTAKTFDGAYQGKQGAAEGILGMLAVIKTDFERTIKNTSAAESKAAREHVTFTRESKVSEASKQTDHDNKSQDLLKTKEQIMNGQEDLQTNMNRLDQALSEILELKPQCIDTGMSYEKRVAKREEEIEALKTALCQLDPEQVEESCASVHAAP